MSLLKGMLTVDDLRRHAADGSIDTVLMAFPDLYGRLLSKRFDVDYFLDEVEPSGGHACDYLLAADMEMNPVSGYRFASWEGGYGDVRLVPDMTSLRLASWLDRTAMVMCDVHPGERPDLAPRSILKHSVKQAIASGYDPMGASELEFFTYATSYREAAASGHNALQSVGWYIEDYHTLQATREEPLVGAIRRHLRDSGVPVVSSKGEWGPGQQEINVRYTDVLAMADRHAVYKQCTREVADQRGQSVTFMAKPHTDLAGSSCHLHVSLWEEGVNAFAGSERLGPVSCSETFRWFLGGWLAHAAELMVFYAPTVNSYKRFLSGSWAPTRLAWSSDNRTAGFRVVGSGDSLRIECRIPGADCNPYLALAASVASGLDGIAKKIDPPTVFQGDLYTADDLPKMPASLREATDLFEQSSFAADWLGEETLEHYVHFYRTEVDAYDKEVTDWERRRYFEQI